jgi:hypothetical protein
VICAAWTNSWCCGAGVLPAVNSDTAMTANGLATARAATALVAVESLRRRRFGTGSLLNVDYISAEYLLVLVRQYVRTTDVRLTRQCQRLRWY